MILHFYLLKIEYAEQDGQNQPAVQKRNESIRRNDVQNEAEDANQGKGPVRPKQEFAFFGAVITALFQTDQQRKEGDQHKVDQVRGDEFDKVHFLNWQNCRI